MEDIISGFEGLARNAMRSFLSAFGIVIAVGSVVLVVSLGDQSKDLITKILETQWGADLLVVQNVAPERRRHWGDDWKNLYPEDLEVLKKVVQNVAFMGAYRSAGSQIVSYDKLSLNGNLKEVDPAYLEARGRVVRSGRNLNWDDYNNAYKVCTIGPELARELFKTDNNAINQEIRIAGHRFQIIGVVDPKNENVGDSEFAKDIYIPLTTGARRFSANKPLDEIVVKTVGSQYAQPVMAQMSDVLFQRHGKWDFLVFSESERIQGIQNIVTMVQAILGALAAISLLVGGIVVMNTMLVSVTERTPEIGLRKSLGARRRDILYQFLAETLALCFLSGLIGLLLGLSAAMLVCRVADYLLPFAVNVTFSTSPVVLLIAFLCSTLVGLGSGVYPAWRASRLDPTVALRYE